MFKYIIASLTVSILDNDLTTILLSIPNLSIMVMLVSTLSMLQIITSSTIHRHTTTDHMEYDLLTDPAETQ